MLERLRARKEWKFFAVLPRADRPARGRLVGRRSCCAACCRRSSPSPWACSWRQCSTANRLAAGLALVGVVFVLLQVLTPIHQAIGANLGDRTAAWLYDRLTDACVRPPGMGHLEDPEAHQRPHDGARFRPGHHRAAAVHLDGLHRQRAGRDDRRPGLGRRAGGYAWWAPLLLAGAWLATHWLLARERRLARPQHRGSAQRPAPRRLRLPPGRRSAGQQGAAALRAGRLDVDRFVNRRTRLFELQYEATRLRERPVLWSLLLVVGANVVVFWSLAHAAATASLDSAVW